jgi:hypothetical protein
MMGVYRVKKAVLLPGLRREPWHPANPHVSASEECRKLPTAYCLLCWKGKGLHNVS